MHMPRVDSATTRMKHFCSGDVCCRHIVKFTLEQRFESFMLLFALNWRTDFEPSHPELRIPGGWQCLTTGTYGRYSGQTEKSFSNKEIMKQYDKIERLSVFLRLQWPGHTLQPSRKKPSRWMLSSLRISEWIFLIGSQLKTWIIDVAKDLGCLGLLLKA